MKSAKEKKISQADIIIIGAGGAGLSAAVAGAEAGATNIIVLESSNSAGGNSLFPQGIFGVETRLQKGLGVEVKKDVAFKKAMDYSHWKLNAGLVRSLINKSSDTIQWLEKKGLVFNSLLPHFFNPDISTYHVISGQKSTGALVIEALLQDCRKHGVRVLNETRARKIVTDKKGRVIGVSALTKEGEINISSKSVIIATGGFTGNKELMMKYDLLYNSEEVIHRGILHKGDGFLMALETGGITDGQATHEMSGPIFMESKFLNIVSKRPNTIWVNRNGERYMNENVASPMEAGNAVYRQPNKISHSLFDQKILETIIADELIPLERMTIGRKPFKDGVLQDMQTCSKKNSIKITSSWKEIARWIGADPETLKCTIDGYNESCDKGYDVDFVKDRVCLAPLRNPPYYAIPGRVAIMVTHGGVKVNRRTEVLDRDDKPIPGLYAAGGDMAGTTANTYNIFLSGHSFGFAVNSGRIAGEEAAGYISDRG